MSKKTKADKLSGFKIPEGNIKDKVSQIIDFLKENYVIKVNTFDTSRSFIESRKKDFKYNITLNTISLHLMQEGISHSDQMLRKILMDPNFIESYNPIFDYLDYLKGKYQGKSQIDELGKYIIARDFSDKTEKFYQKRFINLMRKYFVASIACIYGTHANDVALGFISPEEGIGKTRLCKFLVPADLEDYYISSDKDNTKFDMNSEFTRNVFINFDELVGINRNNPEDFKACMSASHFNIKQRSGYTAKFPRIGNALFTSNRNQELGGFISQNMGYRRFACIEIESINMELFKTIDVDQIWAEAVMLFNNAFDYKWTKIDFEEFKEYNQRFVIETPAMKLIKINYAIPSPGSGLFKTPTEIFNELSLNKKITANFREHISPEKIGTALKHLGFQKASVRSEEKSNPFKAYYVKNLF